jgi:hypothetical protein
MAGPVTEFLAPPPFAGGSMQQFWVRGCNVFLRILFVFSWRLISMITVYLKLREVLRIMFLAIFETVATHLICSAAMQIKCIATIPKMAKNTIRNTSLNFK